MGEYYWFAPRSPVSQRSSHLPFYTFPFNAGPTPYSLSKYPQIVIEALCGAVYIIIIIIINYKSLHLLYILNTPTEISKLTSWRLKCLKICVTVQKF